MTKGYILDTHIFLWAYLTPERISSKIRKVLENTNVRRYISAVTLMEIAQLLEIKPKEVKIDGTLDFAINEALSQLQVQILNITPTHAQRYYEIQPSKDHKDPLDRMIIAQTASTGFTVISDDTKFLLYPVKVLSND